MKAPGYTRLRPNPRRRKIGFALAMLGSCGMAIGGLLGASYELILLSMIVHGMGGFLMFVGSEGAVADDFIKIGLTKIRKERITRIHTGKNAIRVDWSGKWIRSRSYLFARTFYHPDDWTLLLGHLNALDVPRAEDSANSNAAIVDF